MVSYVLKNTKYFYPLPPSPLPLRIWAFYSGFYILKLFLFINY